MRVFVYARLHSTPKKGFVNDGEALVLPRSDVDALLFNLAGAEINGALTNPFFGVL